MEKEVTEVLEEGVVNELENVKPKPSKVAFIGFAAAITAGLLLVFRKKIATKVEGSMVKKLTKKGYTIYKPMITEDEILETIE